MTKAVNFTKFLLDNISPPSNGKRTYYKDTQVKGLSLAQQASGARSFYLIKKIAGRSEKMFLGKYPDLSIENARKLATIKLGQIALGVNPQDEKRLIGAEMTFGVLFDQYMNRYSKRHKKTWKGDERDMTRFFVHWFKRKISDIKGSEIRRLIETIHSDNGPYQANKILQRLRAIYNKAIEWGWQGTNPTIGIKKYPEKSRDRFIQPDEMPWFIKSLEEETNETVRDFLWVLLTLGARKTNTLMMQWEDINWERQEWRIPTTKNGEAVTIPLLGKTLDILARRRKTSTSVWVFSRKQDATEHLINFRAQWQRLLQKASLYLWSVDRNVSHLTNPEALNARGHYDIDRMFKTTQARAKSEKIKLPVALMDIHVHDLRRTFGSYQALTGASLQIIGKSLGHKSLQATQIYARLNLDPVRIAMEKATNAMFECNVNN